MALLVKVRLMLFELFNNNHIFDFNSLMQSSCNQISRKDWSVISYS